MYLASLASAFPPESVTQLESWDLYKSSCALQGLSERSRAILEKVLTGDSGIHKRHFYSLDPEYVAGRTAEELNRSFEQHAPELAAKALQLALEKAGVLTTDLDALFVCTCTGYLCPGVTSHVAERMEMRGDAFLVDLVGLGCGAAIPLLRSVHGFLSAHPDAVAAAIAVEICSDAFYLNNEPGVLISLCLFGDGASASIWRGRSETTTGWRAGQFQTLHLPGQRNLLRFVNAEGKLKNRLHPMVPRAARRAVARLFAGSAATPCQIVSHGGGRDVLDELENHLCSYRLTEARNVLAQYGNCSSPSVLLALEERLASPAGQLDRNLWLTSFGAGFAAHACQLCR